MDCPPRRPHPLSLWLIACLAASSCDEEALREASSDSAPPAGFEARQAAAVVARVEGEVIRVGDVARRLQALSPQKRARYRDPAARRELVDEMIDEALLAAEARRRGLDARPDVREALDAVLREAMKSDAHAALPQPAAITDAELHTFYEHNRALWVVPERRLPSVIGYDDRQQALDALERHRGGLDDDAWTSLLARRGDVGHLVGDLKQVGPPGDSQGSRDGVPEPLRVAVFSIAQLGQLAAEPVEHDGRFYLVRYAGRTAAQTRPFADVRAGVLSLYTKRARERAEAQQLEGLKRRFGVRIDEAALDRVQPPDGFDAYVPYWEKR